MKLLHHIKISRTFPTMAIWKITHFAPAVVLVSMVTSNNWNWWKENCCHNPQHKSSLWAVPVKRLSSMWSYLGKRQHSVLPVRMGGTTHTSYILTQDGTGPYPYPPESCDGTHNICNGRFLYTRPNRRSFHHQAGPPAIPHMTGGTTRLDMLHYSIAPWAPFFSENLTNALFSSSF